MEKRTKKPTKRKVPCRYAHFYAGHLENIFLFVLVPDLLEDGYAYSLNMGEQNMCISG